MHSVRLAPQCHAFHLIVGPAGLQLISVDFLSFPWYSQNILLNYPTTQVVQRVKIKMPDKIRVALLEGPFASLCDLGLPLAAVVDLAMVPRVP